MGKKFFKNYGWAIYLGGALALLDASCFSWKYWAVMLPMIVLVEIKSHKN